MLYQMSRSSRCVWMIFLHEEHCVREQENESLLAGMPGTFTRVSSAQWGQITVCSAITLTTPLPSDGRENPAGWRSCSVIWSNEAILWSVSRSR